MSASNEYTEWHLTPRGWERGTEKTDFQERIDRSPPVDRVLSYKFSEYMSSTYSPLERNLVKFFGDEISPVAKHLLAKFGQCPNNL